jgi:hypothetical protein
MSHVITNPQKLPPIPSGDDERAPIGPPLKQALHAGLAGRKQKGAAK